MELKTLQANIDQWIHTVGVRYFNELTNLALLTEEVGELARVMARRYGEQSAKPGESTEAPGPELADVLFVVVCLANQMHIDLETEIVRSLEKKTKRDTERHQNNPKLRD